ncbi:MAG TPA: DUF58 domain-containing protein [Burkholderiaceae bacterium]|nr:DUF58 domain-containing protein [Burkholderiaceae bacterium]
MKSIPHRAGSIRCRLDQWLFRLPAAESGEVFLGQRRVFIMPSRAGLAFGVLLGLLFIGAVNYNLSLGLALTFLIAGCALVGMYLTFRNLAYLRLSAGRVQPAFAGEDVRFELHLVNQRNGDRYAIWLGFIGADLPDIEQATDIAAHSVRTVSLSVTATRRGWLAAPRVRLRTQFPLGLLRAWSYWHPDAHALVYPRPEDNAPPLPTAGRDLEDGKGQAGHDDFAGVRAYQAGDSLRQLAWRQIARTGADSHGALVAKHFEGGAAGEICLDLEALPRDMALELKLSRMTRWVIEAESRGLAYAFRLDDIALPAALGPAHRDACLRALALYQGR